jgi:hypothetical protein
MTPPELKMEQVKDYLRRTSVVSLNIIRMLGLQYLENLDLTNRLDMQSQALKLSESVAAAQSDELVGVSRTRLKLEATTQALGKLEFSDNVLAGAVLQIAKQGMSTVHGRLSDYPNKGREVEGCNIRDLIWLGRNQAMHYEDTKAGSSWSSMFARLELAYPGSFSILPPYKSHAKAIFDLLGWQSHGRYEADMHTLCIGAN